MDLPPIKPDPIARPLAAKPGPDAAPDAAARAQAEAFEAAFLEEMLKHTGLNRTSETTGGGAGEDAFASFLTREYAAVLAKGGGIGLAEQIFNAIKTKGSGS